jgi:hypothetical protein
MSGVRDCKCKGPAIEMCSGVAMRRKIELAHTGEQRCRDRGMIGEVMMRQFCHPVECDRRC